jgi:hypothetical protein
MPVPILFIDPISEPSRAVHWFTLEAGVPVELRYVWLTRISAQKQEKRERQVLPHAPGLARHVPGCSTGSVQHVGHGHEETQAADDSKAGYRHEDRGK